MKRTLRILSIVVLLSLVSSCSVLKNKNKKKPEYLVHKVQYTGETLGFIARWYTGNFDKWKEIQKYNKIKNPNAISLEQEIKIPSVIAIQDKAPPKSFFAGSRTSARMSKGEEPKKPTKKPIKKATKPVVKAPVVKAPVVEDSLPPANEVETAVATPEMPTTAVPLATTPVVQEEPLDDKTRDQLLDELLEE